MAIVWSGLAAPIAAADRPVEWTLTDVRPAQPNPCAPGETQDVTLTFHVKEHRHAHNSVLVSKSVVTTSAGFVGERGGPETQVINGSRFIDVVNQVMSNPTTGERFKVGFRLMIDLDTGEVLADDMTMRCLGRTD